MKHYNYSDKAFLIQPFYTKYENGKPHTSIKSIAGEINNKGDEVFLKKNEGPSQSTLQACAD